MRCLSVLGLCWLATLCLGGCVLDRTGQSASTLYRDQQTEQRVRMSNLEGQFESLDRRMAQTEDYNRSRGQSEIRGMETIDELREELARMRGELEVLRHEFDQSSLRQMSSSEDTLYRLLWFEERTANIESALGLERPERPTAGSATTGPEPTENSDSQEEEVAPDSLPSEPESESETISSEPSSDAEPAMEETTEGAEDSEDGSEENEAGANESEAQSTQLDPSALVRLAESHLADGREEEARQVLERYLDSYPDHEQVPQALYRIAESYYNEGEYVQAANGFDRVVDYHRESRWAPYAMLRQGECFEALERPEDALAFYRALVQLWPDSRAAREANAKIETLE